MSVVDTQSDERVDRVLETAAEQARARLAAERLALQRRGPRMRQLHFRRAVVRIVVLMLADLAAFGIMRGILRLVRDVAILGGPVSAILKDLLPPGVLGGAQFGVALFVGLLVTGSYRTGDACRDPHRLYLASAIGTGLSVWSEIWAQWSPSILSAFVLAWLAVGLVLLLERLAMDRALRAMGYPRRHRTRAVFVGSWAEFKVASAAPVFSDGKDYEVLGFVEPNGKWSKQSLGTLHSLRRVLLEHRAESVVVCGHLDDAPFTGVVQATHEAGCELLAVPRLLKVTGVEPQLVWRRGYPLIELTSQAIKGHEQVWKRLMDIAVACTVVTIGVPLFLVFAVAITLETKGPVFYRSERWGRFGTRIWIWKFRTMVSNAASVLDSDETLKAQYTENIKLEDDPRITRVGRFLRRWSLDELPQLFNVIVGEMSLVGPRPKLIGEEEKYGAAMDTVLAVRPGLTGLWQISGRSTTLYDERIALDVQYVSHPSIWADVGILLRTVRVVLSGLGAH